MLLKVLRHFPVLKQGIKAGVAVKNNEMAEVEKEFCSCLNGLYFSFIHEIDESTLNDTELKAFSELEMVTKRFSEFENDFKIAPGAYYTKEEVKQAAMKTKKMLQDQWADVLL